MTMNIDNITVEGDASLQSLVLPAQITATSLNGTLTLTNASNSAQVLTGSATGFSVVLPDATTLLQGHGFDIYNQTGVTVTIKTNGGATLFILSQNSTGYLYLVNNVTSVGTWSSWQIIADPSIASGIVNYNIVTATPFTTSSTTDVVITGFTITPQAGTYAVWYSASVLFTTTPITHTWSIYKNGTVVSNSVRSQDTAHFNQTMIDSTQTIIQCNGSEAVDVRVSRGTSGSLTVNARSLILIRLGA